MSATLISACNEALAAILKPNITSLDEASLEARYCNQFQGPLLEEMADWTAWPQLITRTTLAGKTNDRPAEWLYAYAAPNDYGEFIAIRKQEEDATALPELAIPYTLPVQDRYPLACVIEGGTVYTNVEDAILVYSKDTMTVTDFTAKMRRAFVDELAARLAGPVGKMSVARVRGYEQKAMASKLEAICDAENKTPRSEPGFASMAELARAGFLE